MEGSQRQTIEAVTDYFAGQQAVRLAILFGSMANGKPRPDSDMDVAVVGDRPLSATRRLQLIADLARICGRAVDLIDLPVSGPAAARSAILNGKVVYARDETAYPEQITRMLLDSADFLPYRERILRRRRQAWMQ